MNINPQALRFAAAQRGTTLIVAIVLLLVLTVITIFAASVGLSEQRTSTNDLRSKMVTQVAQAGLNEGTEFVRMRVSSLIPAAGQPVNNTQWVPCGASEVNFPCGAEPDSARRATYYKFVGGADTDGQNGVDAIERSSIPFVAIKGTSQNRSMTFVGDPTDTTKQFPVNYNVGALLCRVSNAGGGVCTQNDADTSPTSLVTMVSRATMAGESAATTLTQGQAAYKVFNIPPNTPPIVSSGIMRGIGSATVVSNPNSGGWGVPISVWTRLNMDTNNGSWQTCQLNEYNGTGTPTLAVDSQDPSVKVTYCTNCACVASDAVSKGPGNGGGYHEGFDILDVDNNTLGDLPDSQYFPCDLFEFVFGQKARVDTNNNGICDEQVDVEGTLVKDTGKKAAVVAFLESFTPLDCANLNTQTRDGGFFWVKDGCKLSGQIGSPTTPVVIVFDGDIKFQGRAQIFGVLFARDASVSLNESTGGNAGLDPGGGNGVYVFGAVVLEGGAVGNGGIDIVFNGDVIKAINNSKAAVRFGAIPGSWTDRASY